ncbi:MAG: crossover junction endodeoxyribonuclease RuvC [Candidatus Peribacteraceae bacterium]
MRILGIDPGLTRAGIGLIDVAPDGTITPLEWMIITTDHTLPTHARLLELSRDIEEILDQYKPDTAVVEKLFFATNSKTAMATAEARGAILVSVAKCGIEIVEATPLQLKMSITGDGKADKKQMQMMVQRILKLHSMPEPADAADALALALYGAYTSASRTLPSLTSR